MTQFGNSVEEARHVLINKIANIDIPEVKNRVRMVFNRNIPEGLTSANISFQSQQPDTNYLILCVFNYFTNYRITNKTVDGFTIEVSVAAPTNAKVDYMVVR